MRNLQQLYALRLATAGTIISTVIQIRDTVRWFLRNMDEHPQDIELKEDTKPYHAKAFPIPKIHLETLKAEVERLCQLGILKKVNRSEWAAPTFIIPTKDGSVRFISDF
jgi:hypothetical protein